MNAFFEQQATNDASYRRTVTRIGITMLIMLVLFYGLNWATDLVCHAMLIHVDAVSNAVVRELFDSAAYLLSFMLPVLFLRMMTPVPERGIMPLSPKLPRRMWPRLLAGLAMIYTCATANAVVLEWLGLAPSNSNFQLVEGMPPYTAVLLYLSSVIVPAFCEEFLFRGAVLASLMPYGKTTAVLGSALLFGLMHQSADQFLYTTAAGVVLGLLVFESGSIWSAVLLHAFNNLFAVAQSILHAQMGNGATLVICVLELLVIGGGLLCLVYLVAVGRRDKDAIHCVCERPMRPIRGFFTLPMVAYTVLCVGQMILMIVLTKHLGI